MICWLGFSLVILVMLTSGPLVLLMLLISVLGIVVVRLPGVVGNYFFPYLVFMLFMSGVIMMLMYFCSVVSSEKILVFWDFLLLLSAVGVLSFSEGVVFIFSIMRNLCKIECFEFGGLVKFLVTPVGLVSLFFIIYLLFCLVVVSEIVKKCVGPLRVGS